MSKNTTHIPILAVGILLILSAFGCSKNKADRPSPLTIDSTTINGTNLKIVFSSPAVRKRTIWDDLVPYDEIWRTGANEATYMATSDDININNQKLPAGKYAIFTIPSDTTWTIIFNKEWNQWGAYNYNASKDVFRLEVKPEKSNFSERMMFSFSDSQLVFQWENISYALEISTN